MTIFHYMWRTLIIHHFPAGKHLSLCRESEPHNSMPTLGSSLSTQFMHGAKCGKQNSTLLDVCKSSLGILPCVLWPCVAYCQRGTVEEGTSLHGSFRSWQPGSMFHHPQRFHLPHTWFRLGHSWAGPKQYSHHNREHACERHWLVTGWFTVQNIAFCSMHSNYILMT